MSESGPAARAGEDGAKGEKKNQTGDGAARNSSEILTDEELVEQLLKLEQKDQERRQREQHEQGKPSMRLATSLQEQQRTPSTVASVFEWSIQDVATYVSGMVEEFGERASRYAEEFAKEDISGKEFVHLRQDELKDLGLSMGHRKKLLSKIEMLRAQGVMEGSESASACTEIPSLPNGWEKCTDHLTGRTYYQNHSTFTTQWEHPAVRVMGGHSPSQTNKTPVEEVLTSSEWQNVDMSSLDGQLARVRQISRSGHPRMTVFTASTIRRLKRLPRSSEGLAEDLESLLHRHGPEKYSTGHVKSGKPSIVVVMFSHRWFRGDEMVHNLAHPDNAAGHKAMAMVQFAEWLMWIQAASDPHNSVGYPFSRSSASVDAEFDRTQFESLRKSDALRGIHLPYQISDVAFWIDYTSIDQDDKIPGINALPLYVGACPMILCHETDEYEERAWTRLERVLSFAYSGSAIAMSIKSGFLHRKQRGAKEKRQLTDPRQGAITKDSDRPILEALCDAAVLSSSGILDLGRTEVETMCLLNEDDLQEISLAKAFWRWFFGIRE